jgi:tetratricopeptide (TPR) repeat protein
VTAVLWVIALTVVSVMLGLVIAGPQGTLLGAIPLALGTVLAGYVPTVRDRLREHQTVQERWQGSIEQPLPRSWARLLDPRREVVGFAGRNAELSALVAWCNDDHASRLRLVTGPGGVGKTRLAVELAQQMGASGWRCERITDGKEAEAISALRAATSGHALLVVDYAETRTGLGQMLSDLAGDQGAGLRVLLLARSAGDWWDQLGVGDPQVWTMTQAAKSAELPLSPAIADQLSDADVIELAVHDFARELALPERAVEITQSGTGRRRVLDLHAAALVAVLNEEGMGPVRIDIGTVLGELLRHEMHFWYDSARAHGLNAGPGGLPPSMLRRVVAAGALLGAATEEEARLVVGRAPGLSPSARVARWLQDLYPPGPGDPDWLGSLQPDRLAELHTVRELAASSELASACLSDLDVRQARRAVTLLARASADDPNAEALLSQVLPGVAGFLADLDAPVETLTAIFNAIPYPSAILAPAAVALAGRIQALLPADAETAISKYWQSAEARWFLEVVKLALPPTEEPGAAEKPAAIYRELAAANPSRYRPNLAHSLSSLGYWFWELGRRADAVPPTEEAVAIYRELAAANRDHRSGLAHSLTMLGRWFWELGRRADALPPTEEAVAIYRELAAAHPYHRPDLAKSLTMLGFRFRELGRPADALPPTEEAVAIYRELAAASPDLYSRDLAHSLTSLSLRFQELGRPADDALPLTEEAVAIYRELADAHPGLYSRDLAVSLTLLGLLFRELGRPADALLPTEEAVAICRELAADDPGLYSRDLAVSLTLLGLLFRELGRPADALPPAEEAAAIYRELVAANLTHHRSDLARSLGRLAAIHDKLGHTADADSARAEAAEVAGSDQ